MKKFFLILIAVAAVSACKIDDAYDDGVTPEKLYTYAINTLGSEVICPASFLDELLAIDAFIKASPEERALSELSGKVHNIDDENYHVDSFGDIATHGGSFFDIPSSWTYTINYRDLQFTHAGDSWFEDNRGARYHVLEAEDGGSPTIEVYPPESDDSGSRGLTSHISYPSGSVSVVDPDEYYGSAYYDYSMQCSAEGTIRIEISHDDSLKDWVEVEISGQRRQYRTSRD